MLKVQTMLATELNKKMAIASTVLTELSAGVATITLNRPDNLNAFNILQRSELLNAVNSANQDPDIAVVIVTGAGKGFCAGADLADKNPPEQTVEERINQEYKPILLGIANSHKPYIAAINGVAAGIGASLAMSCDLIVMHEKAYFYQAFSAIGLIPDGGLSLHLSRQLGPKKAYEAMVLGQKMFADESLQSGLVNRISEGGNLAADTMTLATELCKRAPLSLRYTKEVMRKTADQSLADAISIEAKAQLLTNQSEDFTEGKKAFLEKRKPVWKGC